MATRSLAAALLIAGLAAGPAHANGRGPISNGIFLHPTDPHTLYLRTTFGLLISHDDGCAFHWVCEDNVGYGGAFDPKYAIATDGTIFATTLHGLRVSRDGGCSFTTATTEDWIDALAIGPTGEVWIGSAQSGITNDVYRSTDNGLTFKPMGLSTTTSFYRSIRVAPSDAKRVYVTSNRFDQPETALQRTENGGTMWTPLPLTGVTLATPPLVNVAAVDPANADIVYLVSVGASGPSGDKLYRSTDGGQSFTPVLTTDNAIRDVVIADSHVYVTTTIIMANGSEQGGPSFQSTDAGVSFNPTTGAPQLNCLAKKADGTLIGCGANWQPDFKSVATSSDGGQTWTKVWRFVELAGALSCPGGTPNHDVCDAQQWPGLQAQFASTGPTCGAEAVPDMPPTNDMPPVMTQPGGCCDAGAPAGGASLLGFGVLALVLRRRR